MVSTIYLATNKVNNKPYVGFTSKPLERRKERHKAESFSKTQPGYKSAFHDAIRKYGWESFEWKVLYQSWDREHCKNVMEGVFINEYEAYGENGYNMTRGGEGTFGYSPKPTAESNAKRSAKLKDVPKTEQHRINIGLAQKGKTKSAQHIENMKGPKPNISKALKNKPKSPEHVEKMRINGLKRNPGGKTILTPAGIFPSVKAAARELKIAVSTIKGRAVKEIMGYKFLNESNI
jgi:group I intron endonuclease